MARDNGSQWRGFSNVPLSASNKKAAKALKWGRIEAFAYLELMAAAGYKMTITQDPENTAYTVSATAGPNAEGNQGMTMTQRHSDLIMACCAHSVAHFQVCNEKWPDPMQPLFDLDW